MTNNILVQPANQTCRLLKDSHTVPFSLSFIVPLLFLSLSVFHEQMWRFLSVLYRAVVFLYVSFLYSLPLVLHFLIPLG